MVRVGRGRWPGTSAEADPGQAFSSVGKVPVHGWDTGVERLQDLGELKAQIMRMSTATMNG